MLARRPTCVCAEYRCAEPPHFTRCAGRVQLGQTKADVEALERKQLTERVLRSVGWTAALGGLTYALARIGGRRPEAESRTAAIGGAAAGLLYSLVTK